MIEVTVQIYRVQLVASLPSSLLRWPSNWTLPPDIGYHTWSYTHVTQSTSSHCARSSTPLVLVHVDVVQLTLLVLLPFSRLHFVLLSSTFSLIHYYYLKELCPSSEALWSNPIPSALPYLRSAVSNTIHPGRVRYPPLLPIRLPPLRR